MTSGGRSTRILVRALLVAAALVAAGRFCVAGDYPERPIRLFLPFPAGGAVDIVARVVTSRMAEELGRPFVIDNRAGAGGVIATDATAKAAPDGYTLLLTSPNHTINAALNGKLPYDSERDLVADLDRRRSAGAAGRAIRRRRSRAFAGFVDYAQSQSRQAQLRVGRQRHAAACHDGAAAAPPASRSRTSPIAAPRRR